MSKVKGESAKTLDKELNEQEVNEKELKEIQLEEINEKELKEINMNEEKSEPKKIQNKNKKKQKGKNKKKANSQKSNSQKTPSMQKLEKIEEKETINEVIDNKEIEKIENSEIKEQEIQDLDKLDEINEIEKIENKQIEITQIEQEEKETNKNTEEKILDINELDILEENTKQEDIEENIDNSNNEKKNKKLTKYAVIIATISSILIIAVIVFSVIFALVTKNSSKIVSGVSIKGIDVSGLTKDEAKEKINNTVKPNLEQDIQLVHNEYKTAIIPKQIEANFGVDTAVNMAYSIGREGSIIKDNYTIINTHLNKVNINPSFSYNQKILEDFIANISDNLPDKVTQSSYCIEDRNLVISKGKKGYIVQNEELKNKIVDNIVNLKQENTIDIPIIEQQPNPVDIETIRNEIYKEPKDAYYTKEPFTVYPHVNGIDIKMSIEEAKNLVANSAEEDITIPLKITTPNITTNKIGTEAFPNLLASFSTKFSTANGNRATNIRLATSKINGVVLMPGETFSYNQVVGKRTVNAGFREAHMFQNGQVIDGVGGGICQVSSTLYNTVLLSNLEIVERKNHSFNTGYVKIGTDATVSWGGPDFKFKNSRNYPIKLVGRVSGGTVTIDIYGLKEQNEYEVVIESQVLQKIPRQVEYRNTTNLPTGQQKVVQAGYDGFKSRTYKILKLNGSVVSKTLLSTDTYSTQVKIIEVGQ